MKKLFTMIMCTFLIFQSMGCGYAMANNNNTTKSVRRVRKRAKSKTSGIDKIVEVAKIEAERDVKIAEIKHKNDNKQNLEKINRLTNGVIDSSVYFGFYITIVIFVISAFSCCISCIK